LIHVIILAFLSVLLSDNGHNTLATVGLTVSFVLAILVALGFMIGLSEKADESE
jgi:hypothetical protein